MRNASLWSLLFPLVAGCGHTTAQPIPVRGSPADVAAIVGEWDGTYESDDGQRSGSIDFHLQAARDTAFGDAVMIPRGLNRPLQAQDVRPGVTPASEIPRPLVIRFVRVEGGEVSGELESYYDPSCECRKVTSFRGRLKGNTLKGKYRAYRELGGPPEEGEWRVDRKPVKH
jgi:hypothetical protein